MLLPVDDYSVLENPKILWRTDSFLAIWKPHKMHSDQGASVERSLHSWVFGQHSEQQYVSAYHSGDLGLLYRLDYETAGVILYGCNDAVIMAYKEAQMQGSLVKHYIAVTDQEPLFSKNKTLTSYFRSFGPKGREVRAVFDPDTTHKQITKDSYTTRLISTEYQQGLYYNHLTISRGFRHQIRVHLASLGAPIVGDPLYGREGESDLSRSLGLYCLGLTWDEYSLKPLL